MCSCYRWLEHAASKISSEGVPINCNISWAQFHASNQTAVTYQPAITSLLPLFKEPAHSVAMIHHSLDMIKKTVNKINPGQVPVVAFDQPLFSIAKQIQCTWPLTYGEDKFVSS